ncbi:unnamed protein product, partial [Ixodes persulcatus]
MPAPRFSRWSWGSVFLMNHNVFAFGLVTAELGSRIAIPCDSSVSENDNTTGLAAFEAQWFDPKGRSLDASTAPKVDPFTGSLMFDGVLFTDAGPYSCQVRYADGESLQSRSFKHVLQVYQTSVQGTCDCGCELVDDLCCKCTWPYVPNPRRCFKCQRFGHGSQNCRGKATCAKWGKNDHSADSCSNEAHCVNCTITCDLSLTKYNKKLAAASVIKQEFFEIASRYETDKSFFTDGTKGAGYAGCAAVGQYLNEIYRVLRKKRGKKAATHPRDEVPLLSTEISGGTGQDDHSMTSFQTEDLSEDDDDTPSLDFGDRMEPSKVRQRRLYPSFPDEPLGSPPDDSSSSNLLPVAPKKPQKRELHASHQKDPAEVSGLFEDENFFKDPDLLHEDDGDGMRSSPNGDVYKSADDFSDLTENMDARSRKWSKYVYESRISEVTTLISCLHPIRLTASSQDTVPEMNEQLGQEAMDSLNR